CSIVCSTEVCTTQIYTLSLHDALPISSIGRLRRFRALELHGIRSVAIRGGYGAHLIFYRTTGNTVSVERVMHGARDLERRLLERSEEHTSELQSPDHLVCRLLLEKKKK